MRVNYLKKKPWQEQDLGGKRPGKSVCIVRYGGFGDLIQTSTIFPWLKENGWWVTVNTSEKGYGIIKDDPHVDEVYLQGTGQVPNEELTEYWEKLSGCFNRFVQLSESIEGALLALPDRKEYQWKTKKRHQAMNKNYLSHIHRIADVPLPPRPKFYPTEQEKQFADRYLKDRPFTVMWALSGTALHKAYPYTDQVIARLLLETDVEIIFVGDKVCQLLEENWRNEKRVFRESGRLSIRETLALSQEVDLVVGPETGVLNCVAYEPVPKVIMLSHSSPVNLGGTWVNTEVLTPRGVDCYPCHKMHYKWETCNRDEQTGAAMCAAKIHPDRIYNTIVRQRRTA